MISVWAEEFEKAQALTQINSETEMRPEADAIDKYTSEELVLAWRDVHAIAKTIDALSAALNGGEIDSELNTEMDSIVEKKVPESWKSADW